MQRKKNNLASGNPLGRRYDVRAITTIGFTIVIGILLLSIIGDYHTTHQHNNNMSRLVEAAGNKTALAYTMREAIRERVDSLRIMVRQSDPFERDEEKMRFFGHSAKYIRAREELIVDLTTPSEQRIFGKIDATARMLGEPNSEALRALFDGTYSAEEIEHAVHTSIDGHLYLLRQLDEMVRSIHQATQTAIAAAGGEFHEVILMTTASGMAAFAVAVGIAAFVVINAGARNRQLSHHAAHDVLTGLLNRQALEAATKSTLDQCELDGDEHALMLFDLDRFKVVNDTCGHPAGDALLKQLSEKLAAKLRQSDLLARIGGDEFGILLRYTDPHDALEVASKVRITIEQFLFEWSDKTFRVKASIGLVPFGGEKVSLEELFSTADACCYSAKEEGGNRVHLSNSNQETARRRSGEVRWVTRIADAIDNDRFALFGQIIKPLNQEFDDGRLTLEVLLRMRDDEGLGLTPPGQFLPAAERYGMVPDVDRWVVRKSLQWLAGLGSLAANVRININICGPAASDPQFHEFVRKTIALTGVPPKSLCFEITESTAISSLSNAAALIEALGDLGCQFALDDFGSGLSSFNQLRHLKVDYLKIEGSFVQSIDRDPVNRAMVESINSIGKKLGKRTVAEYVENRRVMQILDEMDVDYAQGFALHKPEPLSKIGRMLRETDNVSYANELIVA